MRTGRYDEANSHFSEFCVHAENDSIHFFEGGGAVNYFELCIYKKIANICPEINIAWDQNGLCSKIL